MNTSDCTQDLPTRLLASLGPWRDAPAWCVALSGGLDSTVLLHLLAGLARQQALPPLSAIHIHHGLQAAADAWPAHCQRLCEGLHVPLQVTHVQVRAGASLEQGARQARYKAFEEHLRADEVLLVAQHREDQAETLLFRLLRGTGLRGLAAMPEQRQLGRAQLVRPLLGISRAQLQAYARQHSLSWIEDPSNGDTRFSRNYLRHEVFPLFSERWPQAAQSIARSAAHLSEAQGLLDELAMGDLATASAPGDFAWLELPSLALPALAGLSPARQRNALQYWLVGRTRLPDSQHWAGWESLRDAGDTARPVWRLAEGEMHRAGGRIWWLAGDWLHPLPAPAERWSNPERPLLLSVNGTVRISGVVSNGSLEVRYRQGGEVLELEGRGHRDLKRLLNERGVPLFARARLPLLYRDGQLLAVANLPELSRGGWFLHWQPPTSDQRLR